jgi:hypothetical protein
MYSIRHSLQNFSRFENVSVIFIMDSNLPVAEHGKNDPSQIRINFVMNSNSNFSSNRAMWNAFKMITPASKNYSQ